MDHVFVNSSELEKKNEFKIPISKIKPLSKHLKITTNVSKLYGQANFTQQLRQ